MYIYMGLTYRWRRKEQPIPVLLPGESRGWRSLAGYSSWGRRESDTTERLHHLMYMESREAAPKRPLEGGQRGEDVASGLWTQQGRAGQRTRAGGFTWGQTLPRVQAMAHGELGSGLRETRRVGWGRPSTEGTPRVC